MRSFPVLVARSLLVVSVVFSLWAAPALAPLQYGHGVFLVPPQAGQTSPPWPEPRHLGQGIVPLNSNGL